jgi:cell division transport system ATP-binding protein
MPHELSGGEQQRISIARALVNEPELIIADEPTGNLDPQSSEEIVKLLRELVGTGRSVLFATHDMLLYNKFRSRTLLFENGQVVERV